VCFRCVFGVFFLYHVVVCEPETLDRSRGCSRHASLRCVHGRTAARPPSPERPAAAQCVPAERPGGSPVPPRGAGGGLGGPGGRRLGAEAERHLRGGEDEREVPPDAPRSPAGHVDCADQDPREIIE